MKHFANIIVIGRDRTGVVARVTNFLFEKHSNIEALEEQVTRGQFSMTILASWKAKDWDLPGLRDGLNTLGTDLGMEIKLRFAEPQRKQRVALFVTRESHCLTSLLQGFSKGTLKKAEPALILSNRSDLEPIAKKHGVPFVLVPWNERVPAERQAIEALEKHDIDFIVLARFMKILSPEFAWRYKNKIINIHPSLLPSFPGAQAYRQAYEHGVKIIGVTAHFVNMHLNEGPIIAQGCFHVTPGMSLPQIVAKGQSLESKTLVKAVQLYLSKRLDVFWGVVKQV